MYGRAKPYAETGPLIGMLAGIGAGVLVLLVLAAVLLGAEGAGIRVLAAIWLWAIPVTLVFAGLGYTIARVFERGWTHRR